MTPRQVKALDFIVGEIERVGFAPTLDQIGDHLGITKTRAHAVVSALIAAGKLVRRPCHKRGLELVGVDLRTASTHALQAELARRGVTLGALDRDRPASMAPGTAHCAADGCQMAVQRGHLMCFRHWSALPANIQRGLLSTHAGGDHSRFSAYLVKALDIAAQVRA